MTKFRFGCILLVVMLCAMQAMATDVMFMAFDAASQTMHAVLRSDAVGRTSVRFTQSNAAGSIGETTISREDSNEIWAEAVLSPVSSGSQGNIPAGGMNVITATISVFSDHSEPLDTLVAHDTLFASVSRDGGLEYEYNAGRTVVLPDSIRPNNSFCAHIAHGTYAIPVVCDGNSGVPGPLDVYVMNGCSDPAHCNVTCDPIDWNLFTWHVRQRSNCRITLTMAYCGAQEGCVCIWRPDRELPVELTGFNALAGDNRVMLNWGTASESGLSEFRITRSEQPNDGYVTVARVQARNLTSGFRYSWTDASALNGGTYYYKLHVVSLSGNVSVYNLNGSDVIAEAAPHAGAELPTVFAIEQNYPNPFNSQTSFHFSVAAAEHVTLKIYDVLGREVATVVDRNLQPNFYTVNWTADGLPTGVYMYRFNAGSFMQTKKMLYLK